MVAEGLRYSGEGMYSAEVEVEDIRLVAFDGSHNALGLGKPGIAL